MLVWLVYSFCQNWRITSNMTQPVHCIAGIDIIYQYSHLGYFYIFENSWKWMNEFRVGKAILSLEPSNIIFQLITRHFFHVGPLLSDRHKSHCITAAHSRADEDEQSSSAAAGWSSSQLRAHSSLSCLGRFYFRFETVNIISISRAEQMRKAKPPQCTSK